MSHTFSVIVYGNGDLFIEYFQAIVATLGTKPIDVLLHLAILLSGVIMIFGFIMKRDLMVMVKWFGIFYFATYLLFMPTATVHVTDRLNGDLPIPKPIDHVPLGLAVLASYTSIIGDTLTQIIEQNFTMPDYQPYNKTGMVFASRMMEASKKFEITDSVFNENLHEFINQCVFYDILLHKYSVTELTSTPDLWSFVTERASPARAFVYDGEVTTCATGAAKLSQAWNTILDKTMGEYGKRLFPGLAKEKAKAELMSRLPMSYAYLTHLSMIAADIMKQNILANAMERGVMRMGAKLDASAALESYAFSRGQEQQRLSMNTLADMSAHWLPLMKNVFEAIMYGAFILVVLLSVFPFGLSVLKNYLFTLMWLQAWAPLYAIINLTVSYYAKVQSSGAVDGGLSLKSLSGLVQINADMATLAGYLSMSVPFLAAGLVKGMAGTFTQLAQYMGSVTQSSAGAGAAEAVTGNMSLGNMSLQNHNAFNTSANHFDTSARYSSGMMTSQLPGGSQLTMSQDGTLVMNAQSALSNLGGSINLAGTVRQVASMQAERATTEAVTHANASTEAMTSAVRHANELSQHVGRATGNNENWTVSANAATTKALNNLHQLTDRFASEHGMTYSQAERVLAAAYVEGKVGASIPGGFASGSVGGRAEMDSSYSNDRRNSHSAAKDFVQNSGYSESVDTVQRAAQDHSFRASNDEGKRLVDNMSVSFDKAESARHEVSRSLQEAQSYRDTLSRSQEDAVNFNTAANQAGFEWLNKKMDSASIERMAQHEPQKLQSYFKEFSEEYVKSLVAHQNVPVPASHESLKKDYNTGASFTTLSHPVEAKYALDKHNVEQTAHTTGLSHQHAIDPTPRIQAEQLIAANQLRIDREKSQIDERGQVIKQQGESAIKKHEAPKGEGVGNEHAPISTI